MTPEQKIECENPEFKCPCGKTFTQDFDLKIHNRSCGIAIKFILFGELPDEVSDEE